MFGRPVHLLGAATIAAAASLFSAGTAFANCYSCGPSVIYQAPAVTYSAPMVYGHAYEAPMVYPAPVQYSPGCGCAAHAPMYVVNQGPEYSGPGLTVPYGTYSPGTNLAGPAQYPYVAGPGYGYGPRYPRPYYHSRFTYQGHGWNPYRYAPHRWRG